MEKSNKSNKKKTTVKNKVVVEKSKAEKSCYKNNNRI